MIKENQGEVRTAYTIKRLISLQVLKKSQATSI